MKRQIYYDDTDAGGVMYHTNYLRYMEHARSDFLHVRGITHAQLEQEYRIIFAVRDITVSYIAPVKLGEKIKASAHLENIKHASFYFKQSISIIGQNEELERLSASGNAVIVCVDSVNFKPTKIPNIIIERISSVV